MGMLIHINRFCVFLQDVGIMFDDMEVGIIVDDIEQCVQGSDGLSTRDYIPDAS